MARIIGDKSNVTPGTDVALFVSGSSEAKTVFGGDVHISGSVTVGTGTIIIDDSSHGVLVRDAGGSSIRKTVSIQTSGSVIDLSSSILYTTQLLDYQFLDLEARIVGTNNNGYRCADLRQSFFMLSGSDSLQKTTLTKTNVSYYSQDSYTDPNSSWNENLVTVITGSTVNIQFVVTGTGIVDWTGRIDEFRRQTYVTSESGSYPVVIDTPTLYVDYMLAWYRSDLVSQTSGTTEIWYDKSGNDRHWGQSTVAYKPTYITASALVNNKPLIKFNGSNQFMTGTIWNLGGGNGYWILMAWVTPSSYASNGFLDLSQTTATNAYAHLMHEGSIRVRYSGGATMTWSNPAVNTAVYHSWALCTGSSNQSQVWENGVSVATSTTYASAGKPNNMRIGSLFEDVYYHNGSYAEILIFSASLPDAARQDIELYLSTRYGI